MKFRIWLFFENLSKNSTFRLALPIITDTVHEDQQTFMIFRSDLLRM